MYELIRVFDLFLIGINPVSFARQVKFATVFGMWPSGKRCGRHVSWLANLASAAFLVRQHFFAFVVICCLEFEATQVRIEVYNATLLYYVRIRSFIMNNQSGPCMSQY